jgi:hypothetical protein
VVDPGSVKLAHYDAIAAGREGFVYLNPESVSAPASSWRGARAMRSTSPASFTSAPHSTAAIPKRRSRSIA